MSDEVATTTTTAAATTTTEPTVNKDALDIGEIILNSGYTKDQVNDLIQAPQALDTLRHLIKNNPTEFLVTLEKSDPAGYKKFHDAVAEDYVKRYDRGDKDKDDKSGGKESALMSEIRALRTRVEASESDQKKRDDAIAMAGVKSRYDSAVDDLLNKLPTELDLTKSERSAMRAKLNSDLAADPSAVQRVSTGNFVDVPRKFKSILDEWTTDKTAKIKADADAREKAKSGAFPHLSPGAEPFMPLEPSEKWADSWDSTEEALGKHLERFREK